MLMYTYENFIFFSQQPMSAISRPEFNIETKTIHFLCVSQPMTTEMLEIVLSLQVANRESVFCWLSIV